ncbi:MAG: LeuA family protein [Haloarculaceae archaeon]
MIEFKDLTLREGSQIPGLEISASAGRAVVDELARLDVGCVELSFPRATPRESWYRHAESLGLRTAALARSLPADVDAALAVAPDEIELLATTSDVQLEHALGASREESRAMLVESVERARDGGAAVGVTLMDAVRADDAFLTACARAAVDAGAKHVTLADTTGSGTPATVRTTVSAVVDAVGGDAGVTIHAHDDMGVAAANAAVGVSAGATAVDATVGGVGERAGNAPLEAVAVLLSERGEDVGLDRSELVPACRRVHEALGIEVPPSTPVLGERVYRHESGLHTAAMLREPSTYEAFDPADYGGERALLFGTNTGAGAVRALLAGVGVDPTDERVADGREAIHAAAVERGDPLAEREARGLLRERFGAS